MSCFVNPSSGVDKTTYHLISKGVIDESGKILNEKEFDHLSEKYRSFASDPKTYGVRGDIMLNVNGYMKLNQKALFWIDAIKGEFYPENEYLRPFVGAVESVEKQLGSVQLEDDVRIETEINIGVRNEDASKKRFLPKDYKSTLNKVIDLNKKYPQYQFKITRVMGEKGDDRVYDAIDMKERTKDLLFSTFSYSKQEIKKDLQDNLMEFLYKVNPDFRVEVLEELNDGNGMSINGVLKLNEFLIQLKRGQESALSEEAAHVLVEMLDKSSTLFKDMMSQVTSTRMYKLVLEQYGNHPMYKGNTEKLKREAAAKLVSLYLSDKATFNKMVGSPNILESIKRAFYKLLSFVKSGVVKNGSPFKDAALRILNRNTNDLLMENAMQSEYMFQIADVTDLNYLSTIDVNTENVEKVFINLDDTIFNFENYIPSSTTGKELTFKQVYAIKKSLKETKDSKNQDLKNYYENVNITNLGKELKDKWEKLGPKVTFYTSSLVTQELRDRLAVEFGNNIKIVSTQETLNEYEDDFGRPVYEILTSTEREEIESAAGESTSLVISHRPPKAFRDPKDNFSFAIFDESFFQSQQRVKSKSSRYRTVKEIQEERAKAEKNKEFSETVLAEFSKLGYDKTLKLAQKALKVVRNLVNRIENNESEEELLDLFKDVNGNLVLPLDKAKRIIRQIEDKGNEFEEGLLGFVNTINSVSYFWGNANKTNNYSKLLNYSNREELNKNIKDAATLMRFALNWEEYINSLTTLMEDNEFGDMKVIPEMLRNLRDEIANAKAQINKVSISLMADVLADQAKDYNAALKAKHDSKLISDREYNQKLITPESLVKILTGQAGDLPLTAFVENSLFIGDDVVQAFSYLIEKSTTVANQAAFLEFIGVNKKLQSTLDELGMTDEQMTEEITYVDKKVYMEYESNEDQDNPNARSVPVEKEVRSFMRAHQNEHLIELEYEKVQEIRHKYLLEKEKDPQSSATLELEKQLDEALEAFDRWEKENWNRENITDPEEIYAEFGLDMNLVRKAQEAQELIREQKRIKESLLRQGSLTLDQQKEIIAEIEELIKELKNLRNPWDFKENKLKEESDNPMQDIRIANILKEKLIIDRQIFENQVDNARFMKDLNAILSQIDPNTRALLEASMDTSNPRWLIDFYEVALSTGEVNLIDFLDQNTKIKYSDKFYENREKVFNNIKIILQPTKAAISPEVAAEIEAYETEIDELNEKLKNLASALRDEDGVFNAIDTTPEHQEIIKEIEAAIDLIRGQINIAIDKSSLTKEEKASTKKELNSQFSSLFAIQEKIATDAYNIKMYEYLRKVYPNASINIFPNENFLKLIDTPSFENFISGLKSRKNSSSNPLSQDEASFLAWFELNHLFKTREVYDDFGQMDTIAVYKPTYIWMKIQPRSSKDIEFVPSYKYTKRVYKKEATVDYKGQKKDYKLKNEKIDWVTWNPLTKRWLPQLKGEFVNKEYERLKNSTNLRDRKKFEYLQTITKLYLDKQMQSDVPREGKLGYTLPFVHKRYTEGNGLKILFKQFAGNTNPVEEGDKNAISPKEGKEGFVKKILSAIKAWAGIETEEQETQVVKTDFLGNRIQKFYVKYTGYMDVNDVSKQGISSVFTFLEGLETTRALLGTVKESNLLLQILEQNSPVEVNKINQFGEKIPMKTNRRLDVIRDIVQRKLYGNNKEYELGEWVDNATRVLRNYTVGLSQSVLNPSNAFKNWLQGQITSMTLGGYKNWTDERSLAKAMASKNTSYIKYLMDMKQVDKSLDFQILTLFNLVNDQSLSDKLTNSGYRKAVGLDSLSMVTSQAAEFSVASTVLYAHLYHKDVLINGEKKKLYDVFFLENNKLTIRDNAIDPATGAKIDMDYLANLTVKAKVMNEHISGKVTNATFAQRFTFYKNLEFFKTFVIPGIRTRFVKRRKNLVMGDDIEGFYRTGARFLIKQAISLLESQKLDMASATPEEIEAAKIMGKEILASLTLLVLIGLVFGFDDDDEDRYKKLKDNNWLTNFALLTLLNSKKETEAFSIYPFLNVNNNVTPPIISETWNYVKNPFLGFGAVDKGKKVLNAAATVFSESGVYQQDMPHHFIEKGDTKFEHALRTLTGIDAFLYIGSPELKIQQTQQASARG